MNELKEGDVVKLKGQPDVILTITEIKGDVIRATYFIPDRGFCILDAHKASFEKI